MEDLCLLDEWRKEANYNNKTNQGQRQMWNRQRKTRSFIEDQCVMWYPKEVKIRPCKFKLLWKGPYIVWNVLSNNIILLGNLDEEELFLINVHKLKPYLVWGKLQG